MNVAHEDSAFVREALPAPLGPLACTPVPLCPQISLWLLSQDVDLERTCRELAEVPAPPYWAFCWGAGQALAAYVLAHPEQVRGRRVVDLGAGSGVVGIAAAQAGAEQVTAVDVDLAALRAVRANARLNGVRVETRAQLPEAWDVLLAADVLYEPAVRELVESLAHPPRRILIGAPHRHANVYGFGAPLAEIEAQTVPDVDPPVRKITIFAL